jgi:hypothetical protein
MAAESAQKSRARRRTRRRRRRPPRRRQPDFPSASSCVFPLCQQPTRRTPDGGSFFAPGGVLPFRPWWRRAPTAPVLLSHASNGCSWESRGTSAAETGGALFRLAEALPVSPFFSPLIFFGDRVLWVGICFLDLYRNHLVLAQALIPMIN